MRDFGTGAAVSMALEMFENTSRSSGRTQALVDMARPGDLILCMKSAHSRELVSRLREAGKLAVQGWGTNEAVSVRTIDAAKDFRLDCGTNPHGRVLFDHSLTTEVYRRAIRDAAQYLMKMEQAMSKAPETTMSRRVENIALREDW